VRDRQQAGGDPDGCGPDRQERVDVDAGCEWRDERPGEDRDDAEDRDRDADVEGRPAERPGEVAGDGRDAEAERQEVGECGKAQASQVTL
jgi:hypothetical protein